MIMVAKGAFACELNGVPVNITAGTTVRSGHPILKAYPDMFEEATPDLDWEPSGVTTAPVEAATAAPGEVRGPVRRGPGRPKGSTTSKSTTK